MCKMLANVIGEKSRLRVDVKIDYNNKKQVIKCKC